MHVTPTFSVVTVNAISAFGYPGIRVTSGLPIALRIDLKLTLIIRTRGWRLCLSTRFERGVLAGPIYFANKYSKPTIVEISVNENCTPNRPYLQLPATSQLIPIYRLKYSRTLPNYLILILYWIKLENQIKM